MQKNKLIFEGQEYELYKTNYPEFIIALREPYLFSRTKIRDSDFGFTDYKYKSLVINGEYYGFKLIEPIIGTQLKDYIVKKDGYGKQ